MSTDKPQLEPMKDLDLKFLKARILARLARRRRSIKHVKLPLRYGRVHVTINRPKGDGLTNHKRVLLNKARK